MEKGVPDSCGEGTGFMIRWSNGPNPGITVNVELVAVFPPEVTVIESPPLEEQMAAVRLMTPETKLPEEGDIDPVESDSAATPVWVVAVFPQTSRAWAVSVIGVA